MKPENENLIRDLMNDDSRRENTLLAGSRVMRRRRQWRAARPGAALLALVVCAAVFWMKRESVRSLPAQVAKTVSQPAIQVHALTDDELLALFPNTPVALASLPDGKKRLIFPRPGDEQRFITKL
ncbi:MAG TPA: hypothetical protein VG938_10725 [Verrucomicrobiae bacterium]|jgi:hypothetical protein|nr:hypothetical protein [Verrucomicrobiae bacterium]